MTLPMERTNAIRRVREFLLYLCQPCIRLTKKKLRHEIRYLLKHYPHDIDIEKAAKKCPEVFGK